MDRNKVQEALKPITDGLFGKQRPVRYERPHFKVRPLVRMLQDLTGVDPQTNPLVSPEVMSFLQKTSALGIEPLFAAAENMLRRFAAFTVSEVLRNYRKPWG